MHALLHWLCSNTVPIMPPLAEPQSNIVISCIRLSFVDSHFFTFRTDLANKLIHLIDSHTKANSDVYLSASEDPTVTAMKTVLGALLAQ